MTKKIQNSSLNAATRIAQIEEQMNEAADLYKKRFSSLWLEKETLLDPEGLLKKKDDEANKWRQKALAAEKALAEYKENHSADSDKLFDIEDSITNLESIIQILRETEVSVHAHFLVMHAAQHMKTLSDIYYGRDESANPAPLKAAA